jgi:hypothetical protein
MPVAITVQVSDGNGGSDTQAIAVSVTDQNESGTGIVVGGINIGGGAYTAVASGINYVADPGPGSGTITYSDRSGDPIGGTQDDVLYQTYGYGDFSYAFAVPGAGACLVQIELIEPWWNAPGSRLFDVALEGSVPTGFNDIDVYALAGGQFQALTLTETVTVSDGTLDVDLNTLVDNSLLSAIAVYRVGSSPGNNPPAITSNGGSNTAAVSIAENTTAVTTVTATDPDAGQTLSYSINGGADASKFAINVTTGALAFLTAPNFEAPTDAGGNNVYDVTVQVSDGNGGSDIVFFASRPDHAVVALEAMRPALVIKIPIHVRRPEPRGQEYVLARTDPAGMTTELVLSQLNVAALPRLALQVSRRIDANKSLGAGIVARLGAPIADIQMNADLAGSKFF